MIESPHKGRITALSYHPIEDICVSVSRDGKFNIYFLERKEKLATLLEGEMFSQLHVGMLLVVFVLVFFFESVLLG